MLILFLNYACFEIEGLGADTHVYEMFTEVDDHHPTFSALTPARLSGRVADADMMRKTKAKAALFPGRRPGHRRVRPVAAPRHGGRGRASAHERVRMVARGQ